MKRRVGMQTENKESQKNPYGDPREIMKWRTLQFFLFVLILGPLLWLTAGKDEKKPVHQPTAQGEVSHSSTAD
jgi:hypothetical protein